jgi:hypothetical protein
VKTKSGRAKQAHNRAATFRFDNGDEDDTSSSAPKNKRKRDSLEAVSLGNGMGLSMYTSKFLKGAAGEHKKQLADPQWWKIGSDGFESRLKTVTSNKLDHAYLYDLVSPLRMLWEGRETNLANILFRIRGVSSHYEHTANLIEHLEVCMNDCTRTEAERYAAALGIDLCLPYLKDNNRPGFIQKWQVPAGFTGVVAGYNLPNFQAVFVSTLGRNNEPTNAWLHLMSKVFPRAGASRTFESMWLRYMCKVVLLQTQSIQILVCGLLGNYRGTNPSCRANAHVRRVVNAMFHESAVNAPPVDSVPNIEIWNTVRAKLFYLLFSLPISRLCLLLMREYAFYDIEDNPALYDKAVDMLPHYHELRELTMAGMDEVRCYLNANLLTPGGTMTWQEIDNAKPTDRKDREEEDGDSEDDEEEEEENEEKNVKLKTHRPWQCRLRDITELCYKKSKEKSYRKAPLPDIENFKKAVGRCTPTMGFLPAAPKMKVYFTGEPTPNEKCEYTRRARREKKKAAATAAPMPPPPPKSHEKKEAKGDASLESSTSDAPLPKNLTAHIAKVASASALEEAKSEAAKARARLESNRIDAIERDYVRMELGPIYERRVLRREAGAKTPGAVPLTRDRITIQHDVFLRKHILAARSLLGITTSTPVVFQLVCQLIARCGASVEGIQRLIQLANSWSVGTFSRRAWEDLLQHASNVFPYTYNLMMASCGIWCGGGGFQLRVYPLSQEMRAAQLKSTAYRFRVPVEAKTGLPTHLSEGQTTFTWCEVCGTIYTVGFDTIRSKKHRFTHGLQGCVVDTKTWQPYCKNTLRIGSTYCKNQPLRRYTGLPGNAVEMGGKMYTICAQPKCGMLFLMDSNYTSHNRHGPRCFFCTIEYVASKHRLPSFVLRLLQGWIRPSCVMEDDDTPDSDKLHPPKTCLLCEKSLSLNDPIHIFGVNLYVCNHKSHGVKHWKAKAVARIVKHGIPLLIDENVPIDRLISDIRPIQTILLGCYASFKATGERMKVAYGVRLSKHHKRQQQLMRSRG